MAFFDKLGEVAKNIGEKTTEVAKNIGGKTSEMAKNIGDKTSDAIETRKLNSKIKEENSAAAEELRKIGEYYYNQFVTNGGGCDAAVLEFCQCAKEHYDAAAQAQAEIDRIKTENEAGKAHVAETVSAEEGDQAAASAEETASASEQLSDRKCPNCGTLVGESAKFCNKCGQQLD